MVITCYNDTVAKMRRVVEPRVSPARLRTNLARKWSFYPHVFARESRTKRVSGTVYRIEASWHGLRSECTRIIGSPWDTSRFFIPPRNYTILFIVLNFGASRCFSSPQQKKRRTIDRDFLRPMTLTVLNTITFKHEQHTFQRYTYTRTWPNVLGTRIVVFTSTQKRAHVYLHFHACTAPTCSRTLVSRVRVLVPICSTKRPKAPINRIKKSRKH